MKVYSRVTGEGFDSNPEAQHAQRMARMRNRVWWGVCSVSRETNYSGGRPVMITLTYAPGKHWAPAQIGGFTRWMFEKYDRAFVWVAELQKRGAMHYHVLTSLPDGVRWDKDEIEFEWYFGLVWITDNIRKPMYIMKYLQKGYQKNGNRYPRGAHIVGAGGITRYISDAANRERLYSRLPYWAKGSLVKSEIREVGGTCVRTRGGVRLGGQLAVTPFSRYPLAEISAIGRVMELAHRGDVVYTERGWELPQPTQL